MRHGSAVCGAARYRAERGEMDQRQQNAMIARHIGTGIVAGLLAGIIAGLFLGNLASTISIGIVIGIVVGTLLMSSKGRP